MQEALDLRDLLRAEAARKRNIFVGVALDEARTVDASNRHLLAVDLAPGARVLACSGPGVTEALEAKGFEVVDASRADAGPVEQGPRGFPINSP